MTLPLGRRKKRTNYASSRPQRRGVGTAVCDSVARALSGFALSVTHSGCATHIVGETQFEPNDSLPSQCVYVARHVTLSVLSWQTSTK